MIQSQEVTDFIRNGIRRHLDRLLGVKARGTFGADPDTNIDKGPGGAIHLGREDYDNWGDE